QLARVQIESVLMLNPSVIIAYEPTSSLDAVNGYNLLHLIKYLGDVHQVILLIIPHTYYHVVGFSDWINVIKQGKLIDINHVQAFKKRHVKPYSLELFDARSQLRKDGDYD